MFSGWLGQGNRSACRTVTPLLVSKRGRYGADCEKSRQTISDRVYARERRKRARNTHCKLLTDIGDLFTASFGRIFCSAKNRALRVSALTRSGPNAPHCGGSALLQSLAHEPPAPLRGEYNPSAEFCRRQNSGSNCRIAAITQSLAHEPASPAAMRTDGQSP
jgi:hypothetical protein